MSDDLEREPTKEELYHMTHLHMIGVGVMIEAMTEVGTPPKAINQAIADIQTEFHMNFAPELRLDSPRLYFNPNLTMIDTIVYSN